MSSKFDQQHLADLGFTGFVPLRSLPRGAPVVPRSPGIYAVTFEVTSPTFLAESVGGQFKEKDPTVELSNLAAKWNEDVATVYIGRATSLRRRLDTFARFGRGEPVAHWGGRYLWQLAAHDDLRIAWRIGDDPIQAEAALLDDFEAAVGRLPFANLLRGRRAVALA